MKLKVSKNQITALSPRGIKLVFVPYERREDGSEVRPEGGFCGDCYAATAPRGGYCTGGFHANACGTDSRDDQRTGRWLRAPKIKKGDLEMTKLERARELHQNAVDCATQARAYESACLISGDFKLADVNKQDAELCELEAEMFQDLLTSYESMEAETI